MEITEYKNAYRGEVIDLVISIQNEEAKINLSLEEQDDLQDIEGYFFHDGGKFWIALEDGAVIGTIGLVVGDGKCGILKKFFVRSDFRSKKVGLALYEKLLECAERLELECVILDTPSVAKASHRFYERAGFRVIDGSELPIAYCYPDRNSLLYKLTL